ncbi:Lrp/AsnC family transcriptional regulator [Pseudarthrobacter oxydans]|uniref:Lrp/AsnC family transcriptional regulator n=1 Tax=Pseudarthrobacter oxydans TaxID=1671 RepID=UPI00380C22F8
MIARLKTAEPTAQSDQSIPAQFLGAHVDLDDLDLKLIDELQQNGRVPYAEVARRIGVTEKTVRRRVLQMIESRLITITAVTDPASLGFDFMALTLVRTDNSRSPVELAAELASLSEVDYVTVTTGPFAVQAELMGVSAAEIYEVVDEKIRTVAGVASVELLPYLRLHYQQARFAHHGRPEGIRPRELDHIDRAIVSYLAVDGRAPLLDLAHELGVSEAKIRFRYGKLIESGAVRVMCIVNPLRLGYRYTSWVLVNVGSTGRAQDVAEALTSLSAVSYVAVTAGRCDVLAEVVAGTGEELIAILDEQIRPIDGVAGVESWLYVGLHYKAIRPRHMSASANHARDIQIV